MRIDGLKAAGIPVVCVLLAISAGCRGPAEEAVDHQQQVKREIDGGARSPAVAAGGTSTNNTTRSRERQFKPATIDSGQPYPPADLVIVQEIRADLTADGSFERVVIGYHKFRYYGYDAYLCIYKKATSGRNEDDYREVYRDHIGGSADDVHLECAPEDYCRELEAYREREQSQGKATDIRVSGGGYMVVASGTGWMHPRFGLNVEMVVWDVSKRQFKRIFAISWDHYPLIEHVDILNVDLDGDPEVVVFSATGHWNDPEAKHTCRVYKWNSKQKRYVVVSPDKPLKTQGASGWICTE